MTALPRLHVITDDDVLARDRFVERATALLEIHGPAVAFHLRGPRTPTRALFQLAETLAPVARSAGGLFLINDRADVALAVGADGVHLGQRSMTAADARILRADWTLGVSVHSVAEADVALGSDGARETDNAGPDFLLVGSVWTTPSHPGQPGAGLNLVRDVQARAHRPVFAIGGVTPGRVAAVRAVGGAGVAVLSGVWDDDPTAAAGEYLDALERADGETRRSVETGRERANGEGAG